MRLHLASRPMRPGCCTDPPRIPFTRWVRKSGTATIACGRTSRMLSAQRSTRDSAKATVAPFTNASSSATRSSMWLRGRMESATSPACKRQLVAGGVDVVQHVAVSQDRTAGDALLVDRLHDGRHVGPIEPIHPCLPCLRARGPRPAPARCRSRSVTTSRTFSAGATSTTVGAMPPNRDSWRSSSTNISLGRRPRATCSIRASDSPGSIGQTTAPRASTA